MRGSVQPVAGNPAGPQPAEVRQERISAPVVGTTTTVIAGSLVARADLRDVTDCDVQVAEPTR